MLYKNYIKNYKKIWQEAMAASERFSLEKQSASDVIKLWDNNSVTYDNAMGKDLRRINLSVDILKAKNMLNTSYRIIDIGSGTGSYTLPLSKYVKEVDAFDISGGMNNILKTKIAEQNIRNINIVEKDWQTLDIKKENMYEKYDLAISSLNPALYDFDNFVKMIDVTRGGGMYVTAAGPAVNRAADELNHIVFGKALQKGGGNDGGH